MLRGGIRLSKEFGAKKGRASADEIPRSMTSSESPDILLITVAIAWFTVLLAILLWTGSLERFWADGRRIEATAQSASLTPGRTATQQP